MTVVETGGFNRAADQLQASAAAVSRRVSGLENALGTKLNSCPETFTACSTETFGSLLQHFVQSKPEKKEECEKLLTHPTAVHCCDAAECNFKKRVQAGLTDSCDALSNHQLRFLAFLFQGDSSVKTIGSHETLKMLMSAQERQALPERCVSMNEKSLSLDLQLFNCIVL